MARDHDGAGLCLGYGRWWMVFNAGKETSLGLCGVKRYNIVVVRGEYDI